MSATSVEDTRKAQGLQGGGAGGPKEDLFTSLLGDEENGSQMQQQVPKESPEGTNCA